MKIERPLRDFEWSISKPYFFKGASILELGNKKNSTGVYKQWFQARGHYHVSIDINGLDGAIPLDLRGPVRNELIARGEPTEFDVLTNSGVIEHVETNQEAAWRNAYELVKVGGVQIHITPAANHWMAHGLYHPTQEFFLQMAELNLMRIEFMDTYRWTPGKVLTRCILRKFYAHDFVYPGDEYLCKTPDCLELERRRNAGER